MDKVLPTVHHWRAACGHVESESMVAASNFGNASVAPVGAFSGVSEFGVYDLAGNVREWCWNSTAQGGRHLRGGSFREPSKMYLTADSRAPMDRSSENGFRCARYLSAVPDTWLQPTHTDFRDNRLEIPCSDDVFAGLKMSYAYDPPDLGSATQSKGRENDLWRQLVVRFRAPHVPDRLQPMITHVFLPRTGVPPYQAVVFFPGLDALTKKTFPCATGEDLPEFLQFLLHSGRAVVWPVYEGTYERRVASESFITFPPAKRSETGIRQYKDLACTVDYLQTRNDIDAEKLAFIGSSLGGEFGIRMIALEKRFKAAVLVNGGLTTWAEPGGRPPVVDEINFVPRITVPVLLFGGEYDVPFPVKESQQPLLELLGTPREHIKHHLEPGAGHYIPTRIVEQETRDWLDTYLGLAK